MDFLRNYFGFNKEPKIHPYQPYNSAGIVFTNGTHFLAGYQPNKRKPFISGIGGSKNLAEKFLETAIRETIEELFDVIVPCKLIFKIIDKLEPKKVIRNNDYMMVLYSFDDLKTFLKICYKNIKSPIYNSIPRTLDDLLFKRKPTKTSEISQLCLLPIVDHPLELPFIDKNLVTDIKLFI